MKKKAQNNPVIFAGAGPGDPDLITVKGQQALKDADLIIYAGSLVPEAVLKWAGESAEKDRSGQGLLPARIEFCPIFSSCVSCAITVQI